MPRPNSLTIFIIFTIQSPCVCDGGVGIKANGRSIPGAEDEFFVEDDGQAVAAFVQDGTIAAAGAFNTDVVQGECLGAWFVAYPIIAVFAKASCFR